MTKQLFSIKNRRGLAALLALALALCLLPGAANAAGTVHEVNSATALTDAFAAAASGDTIKLTGNIALGTPGNSSSESFIIYSSSDARNLTLDLNGKSISFSNTRRVTYFIELNGTGTLTIADSAGGGSINGGNMLSLGIINASGDSNVTVTGGTLLSDRHGISGANGTITVSGGTITSTGDRYSAIGAETSDVIVSGGTLEASGTDGVGIRINYAAYKNITLTGLCTIKGQSAAISGKAPVINTTLLATKASADYSGSPLVDYAASNYTGYKYISITAVKPAITTQPTSQSVTEGRPVTFTVAATGDPAPDYQWYSSADGIAWDDISGETSSSFTMAATTLASNGMYYRCVASNTADNATSNAAQLTVIPLVTVPVTVSPAATFPQGNAPQTVVTVGAGVSGFDTHNFVSAEMGPAGGTLTALTSGTDFDVADGSIVLTLHPSYLNTLTPGAYTLRINLAGTGYPASRETRIVVTAPGGAGGDVGPDVPKTGDGSTPLFWTGLMLLAGMGLAASAALERKKRHSR